MAARSPPFWKSSYSCFFSIHGVADPNSICGKEVNGQVLSIGFGSFRSSQVNFPNLPRGLHLLKSWSGLLLTFLNEIISFKHLGFLLIPWHWSFFSQILVLQWSICHAPNVLSGRSPAILFHSRLWVYSANPTYTRYFQQYLFSSWHRSHHHSFDHDG